MREIIMLRTALLMISVLLCNVAYPAYAEIWGITYNSASGEFIEALNEIRPPEEKSRWDKFWDKSGEIWENNKGKIVAGGAVVLVGGYIVAKTVLTKEKVSDGDKAAFSAAKVAFVSAAAGAAAGSALTAYFYHDQTRRVIEANKIVVTNDLVAAFERDLERKAAYIKKYAKDRDDALVMIDRACAEFVEKNYVKR